MNVVLLSIHVLAAIVLIGPITVAASLFPRYARGELARAQARAGTSGGASDGPTGPRVTQVLHRITAVYAVAALAVPVFGIGTAATLDALGQVWLIVSMALTAVAALNLALLVVPAQREVIALLDRPSPDPDGPRLVEARLGRLAMSTGLFGLTWAIVVVLMILRPGSTTGV